MLDVGDVGTLRLRGCEGNRLNGEDCEQDGGNLTETLQAKHRLIIDVAAQWRRPTPAFASGS